MSEYPWIRTFQQDLRVLLRLYHDRLVSKYHLTSPDLLLALDFPPLPEVERVKVMKMDELKELCREQGLPVAGLKNELISRLGGGGKSLLRKRKRVPAQRKRVLDHRIDQVIAKLQHPPPSQRLPIRRNDHGHFEYRHHDTGTGLIFEPTTKKVYARQLTDGRLAPLREKDLLRCREYRIPYIVPENLDEGDQRVNDQQLEEELGAEDFYDEEEEEEESDQEVVD